MEWFLTTFKNYVELGSKGEIELKYFPSGQLGSIREVTESCNLGIVEMGLTNEAVLVTCTRLAGHIESLL